VGHPGTMRFTAGYSLLADIASSIRVWCPCLYPDFSDFSDIFSLRTSHPITNLTPYLSEYWSARHHTSINWAGEVWVLPRTSSDPLSILRS
jgi:hypothetical protein